MAIRINLLPAEKRVSAPVAQALRIVRMLGVISLAAFLVFALGLGVFLIISSVQLNGLNSANDSLKSQISGLSTSESQLFVLKDRISKIKLALSSPSSTKNLSNFVEFTSGFSSSSSINQLDVNSGKITATLNFNSNSDLSSFIEKLSASTVFKSVSFSSFGFSPSGGYLVSVAIDPK